MNSKKITFTLSLVILFTLCVTSVYAEGDVKTKTQALYKVLGVPVRTFLDINLISTVFKNTGISDIDVDESNSGLVFPKGSGKTAVFQSGFLWGAKVAGVNEPQVGGTAYREGLQAGKILNSGLPLGQLIAESETAPNVRIYRVRPDVYPGGPNVDLVADAVNEQSTVAAVRAQYELDWLEWPATDGAPFDDIDGNGLYDPTVDIPGFPGADQTVWNVANDLNASRTQNLYGANPLGIEQQSTYWAYSQTGALGSMIFRKYKIINKGNLTLDSMYVSMWSDVDLGNSTDDFAGTDTTLSLGYCYNANAIDGTYKELPPPAVGFDFFQGPKVDGKPLPMTAFYYFARGDPAVTDPTQGSLEGSVQFYNFFRGRIGISGEIFTDPKGNETVFALSGDPATGTGWLDGQLISSGDRRIGLASGPFQMAPGDTQEVVVAEIVAGAIPGVDRISAIGLLKFYDQFAQSAFDNNFDLPVAPPVPEVTTVALDKKIIIDWGESPARVSSTENYFSKGHTFQGYNVYQLPSASADVSQGVRLATFDVADGVLKINDDVFDVKTGSVVSLPVRFGNDTGIKRFFEVTSDAIKGGTPLINGIRYYFAVTAYSYNPDVPVGKSLENPIKIITVIPQSKNPGQIFDGEFADTLSATHNLTSAQGGSDGSLYPVIVDPTKLTGLDYKVTFEEVDGNIVWNVDRSDDVRVLSNQTNQLADEESPIVDGIQFRVKGAPLDFKGFEITANANGPITGAECTFEVTQAPTDGIGISADWFRDVAGSINGGTLSGCVETPMQVAGGYFFIAAGNAAGVGTVGDHVTMINRLTNNLALFSVLIPNNYEIRWTGTGKGLWPSDFQYAHITAGLYDVPFELWYLGPNLDNTADDVRMIPIILDMADTVGTPASPSFDFQLDSEASGGNNDPYSDWIYFHMPTDQTPGDAGYQSFIATNPTGWGATEPHLRRVSIFNWNQHQGGGGVNEQPEVGTVFRFRTNVPNAIADEFTFSTQQAVIDNDLAKTQVGEINVFPNPYYGVNTEELNRFNRFVTFTHLPANAIIRIFNIAGVLIKKIEKNDAGQFLRWDLANESGLPVASGLYLAYIDLPDLGQTKILKLAIIQERQILDRF